MEKHNYTSYKDFIYSDDFIKWQLYQKPEDCARWNEFMLIHPHLKPHINKAIQVIKQIDKVHYNICFDEQNDLYKKIEQSVTNTQQASARKSKWLWSVAASVLFIISSYYFINNQSKSDKHYHYISQTNTISSADNIKLVIFNNTFEFNNDITLEVINSETLKVTSDSVPMYIHTGSNHILKVPYGKKSAVILPDQTKVWLNSGSEIAFPAHFTVDSRNIHLSGEAYMEVHKDPLAPFHIHTNRMNIKVLGTTLNISDYTDNSSSNVVLVNGKVEVEESINSYQLLTPHEKFEKIGENWSISEVDVSEYISWKDNYIVTKNKPISELLKIIERQYNVKIIYKDRNLLEEKTCTGKFILNKDLDTTLKTISALTKTKYYQENNTVFID